MCVQFAMLASGSRGNAALLRASGFGLLVDVGLRPRALADRLASLGCPWSGLSTVLLTHTHGDHISAAALAGLTRFRVPLRCHEGHRPALRRLHGFARYEALGLLRTYDDRPFLLPGGWRVEPLTLSHDGGPTFGFRFELRPARRVPRVAVGYVADTGCWHEGIADGLADADLVAIEFNHDVELQRGSGRHPALIARNLGDRGHLSNDQGAGLLSEVLARSARGSVRQVVLLHLSEQCNRPELALQAARGAVRGAGVRATIRAALQAEASAQVALPPRRRVRPCRSAVAPLFPWEAA